MVEVEVHLSEDQIEKIYREESRNYLRWWELDLEELRAILEDREARERRQ